MRLNGWQRLWVLFSAIYLIVGLVIVVLAFPDGSYRRYLTSGLAVNLALKAREIEARDAGNERAELEVLRLRRGAAAEFSDIRTKYYNDLSDADLIERIRENLMRNPRLASLQAELEKRLQEDAAALHDERIKYVVTTVPFLLLPIFVVYALGGAIGWVVRGFRKKE